MSSKRIPRKLARITAARAHWRCEYCLSPAAYSTQPFEVDHIIPEGSGGRSSMNNLAFACGCNSYKACRTEARVELYRSSTLGGNIGPGISAGARTFS